MSFKLNIPVLLSASLSTRPARAPPLQERRWMTDDCDIAVEPDLLLLPPSVIRRDRLNERRDQRAARGSGQLNAALPLEGPSINNVRLPDRGDGCWPDLAYDRPRSWTSRSGDVDSRASFSGFSSRGRCPSMGQQDTFSV